MTLTQQEESLIEVIRPLHPDEVEKMLHWAEQLPEIAVKSPAQC